MLPKPYSLIIVDDEEGIRDILTDICEDNFDSSLLSVKSFADPLIALEYVKKNDVRFLILDIKMKEGFGDMLLADFLKARPALKTVICSGEISITARMTCYLNGANRFIGKPVDEQNVVNIIKEFIEDVEYWSNTIFSVKKNK